MSRSNGNQKPQAYYQHTSWNPINNQIVSPKKQAHGISPSKRDTKDMSSLDNNSICISSIISENDKIFDKEKKQLEQIMTSHHKSSQQIIVNLKKYYQSYNSSFIRLFEQKSKSQQQIYEKLQRRLREERKVQQQENKQRINEMYLINQRLKESNQKNQSLMNQKMSKQKLLDELKIENQQLRRKHIEEIQTIKENVKEFNQKRENMMRKQFQLQFQKKQQNWVKILSEESQVISSKDYQIQNLQKDKILLQNKINHLEQQNLSKQILLNQIQIRQESLLNEKQIIYDQNKQDYILSIKYDLQRNYQVYQNNWKVSTEDIIKKNQELELNQLRISIQLKSLNKLKGEYEDKVKEIQNKNKEIKDLQASMDKRSLEHKTQIKSVRSQHKQLSALLNKSRGLMSDILAQFTKEKQIKQQISEGQILNLVKGQLSASRQTLLRQKRYSESLEQQIQRHKKQKITAISNIKRLSNLLKENIITSEKYEINVNLFSNSDYPAILNELLATIKLHISKHQQQVNKIKETNDQRQKLTKKIIQLQKKAEKTLIQKNGLQILNKEIILQRQQLTKKMELKLQSKSSELQQSKRRSNQKQIQYKTKLQQSQRNKESIIKDKERASEQLKNKESEGNALKEKVQQFKKEVKDKNNKIASLESDKNKLKDSLTNIEMEMEIKMEEYERSREEIVKNINKNLGSSEVISNNTQAIVEYINRANRLHAPTVLTVSNILEKAAEERNYLVGQINKFLEIKIFSSKMLFSYDQFNKNFSNYLPIKSKFDFLLLVKTKNEHIFGIFSSGLGKDSKVLAINLSSKKSFRGQGNDLASNYQNNYLTFGFAQIRLKNNSNLEITIKSATFGSRYFSFRKEQLAGQKDESSQPIQLQSIEIHKIMY